jgi:pyruvate dehydrogenase E2 component (dihydrolipoamide acetyltransferase)
MAKVLEMPKLSPTMEEGVLSSWHKKEGDEVAIDDLLAEVETDKATMEFRAFDKGTLLKILAQPGATVKLGQPVAILGAPGEDVSALVSRAAPTAAASPAPATGGAPTAPPPAPRGASLGPTSPPLPSPAAVPAEMRGAGGSGAATGETMLPPETSAPPAQRVPPVGSVLERTSFPGAPIPAAPEGQPDGGRVIASPYVRKVAREKGIDLHGAQGSGAGGRVLPADLETMRAQGNAALTRVSPTAPPAAFTAKTPGLAESEVRALSPMRRTIAKRLTESKTTVPHFYLRIDVDAGALTKLRADVNTELAAAGASSGAEPVRVSLNDLLVKACALALVRVPECNASFSQDAILVHRRVDISVAVAIPDGLVTPVVRNADRKSVAAIAGEVRDLAARARARKLKPEEMSDGTFSISNLGMFGIDEFAAVINPPEGAILAVGQVREVPVVVDGAVAAGKRLALTLSCDHRVVDGAIGAAFLAELKHLVERPLRVLAG